MENFLFLHICIVFRDQLTMPSRQIPHPVCLDGLCPCMRVRGVRHRVKPGWRWDRFATGRSARTRMSRTLYLRYKAEQKVCQTV